MTSKNFVIHVQSRGPTTQGAVRKLRQSGLVPGVLYKKGVATQISVPLSQLPKEHTRSTVLHLVLDGSPCKTVLMREVQVNPLNDKPIHFDFQEVEPGDKVRIHVPLHFVGLTREQEKEGHFSVRTRYLEVKTTLELLPKHIEVNVGHLKVEHSVRLHDLSLPHGVVVRSGHGKNIALASLVKV